MDTLSKYRTRNIANPRRSAPRSAFTLVEILVAITVIGILVGMLAVAVFPVLNTANETAITTEMKQIEMSIENFKTQYGFYPPSFLRINSANDLLPYLNRISPNHREGSGAVGSRPIDLWWSEVGATVQGGHDHGDDLVFWMSGLFKNKQYPLTNGAASGSMPNAYDDGTPGRDVFYDFNDDQMNLEGKVANYLQPAGAEESFRYIDAKSYGYDTTAPIYDGYTFKGIYLNPKTFQLISLGMDGLPGNPGDIESVGPEGLDNITNFAEGRLERFIINNTD